MKKILFCLFLISGSLWAQKENKIFNEKLAKSLKADKYGMRNYVFCILKTGSNTEASSEEKTEIFKGHMANIERLSKEGKLIVAGPFLGNSIHYRGLFIFNVETVEEAQALVNTDPAVKAKIFEAELTPWYGSAALQEIPKLHEEIAASKF